MAHLVLELLTRAYVDTPVLVMVECSTSVLTSLLTTRRKHENDWITAMDMSAYRVAASCT